MSERARSTGRGARGAGGRCAAAVAGAAAIAAVAVPGVAAQWDDGPSILSLLPVRTAVSLEDTLTGALGPDDYLAEGRRVAAYAYEGAMGDPLIIDLVSDEFDAYLVLLGPDGVEAERDDDSGGACHARISTFLEDAGTHRIVVSSLSGETGSFTLTVGQRLGPQAPGECGGGYGSDEILDALASLEPRGSLSLDGPSVAESQLTAQDVELGDGSYGQAWLVVGEPGTTVWVDLESRAFDAYLYAVAPGWESYESDDDSGGACNSRLPITLGDEPHLVVASSLFADETGPFTLRVSSAEGPEAVGPCP